MARFRTADGRAVPAVTADEMRAVDRVAVEDVGLSLLQMMENAGRRLASTARETATRSPADGPVVVLAGDGGNGGGGLCAARHLSNHGTPVRVVLDRGPGDLSGAAAAQHRVLAAAGVPVGTGVDLADAGVVVDALVGYGLEGPLRGRAGELAAACNRATAPTLSLDVPSGVDASTGARPGPAVVADRTLTLALPKHGLADGGGDLWLADIAIPPTVFERVGVPYRQPFGGRPAVPLTVDERDDEPSRPEGLS
jgi:NAD(P)H-hydrate epimerase